MTTSGARKLYTEDIDKYKHSNGCMPKSAKIYQDPKTGNIDYKKWREENPDGYAEYETTVQKCTSDFYNNGEKTGCCFNETANEPCLTPDNYTGLNFLGINDKVGNICHKEPVQNIYNTLFDDSNSMVKFFKLVLFSIISLLITALIGTCYEFWLRYGNSVDCIYYKSKCANIGKTDKISLIDYMFPNNICYYPYQSCGKHKPNQSGGKKQFGGEKEGLTGIISTFAEYERSGAKCITVDYDSTIFGEKPIPYNIADYAINNVSSEYINVLAKTISFYFLFSILFTRKVLNWLLGGLSSKFQKHIKFNPLLSNLTFLILTGLLFPIIGYFTKIEGLYYGPMIFIGGLLILANMLTSIGFFVGLISTIIPDKIFGRTLAECNLSPDYYRIFRPELFYSLKDVNLKDKVFNIIKNVVTFFPLIFLTISSVVLGSLMSVMSSIYMTLSLVINIFLIPLSNPLECFSILKSHADLLTILFIMGVIGASANSLDSVTTGVMSMILVSIIVYKSFIGMKNSI
jgi:hypothetical protein